MANTISVRGLTDEQVQKLKKLVRQFREQNRQPVHEKERIEFASWPLGVKDDYGPGSRQSNVIGKLTREDIYEDR